MAEPCQDCDNLCPAHASPPSSQSSVAAAGSREGPRVLMLGHGLVPCDARRAGPLLPLAVRAAARGAWRGDRARRRRAGARSRRSRKRTRRSPGACSRTGARASGRRAAWRSWTRTSRCTPPRRCCLGALRRRPSVFHFQGPWAEENVCGGRLLEHAAGPAPGARATRAAAMSTHTWCCPRRFGACWWSATGSRRGTSTCGPPGVALDVFTPGDPR